MTELVVPRVEFLLQARTPDLVQSCTLFSPETIDPIDPADPSLPPGEDVDLWLPAAPGVVYTALPQEPIIIDTSPAQMIGCIGDTGDNPQGRLNALFPDAEDGDGVVERVTNDIWVFDGATWNNVGATPGPTMSTQALVPVWSETVIAVAQTRTRVNIQVFDYDPNAIYEIEATTRTSAEFNLVKSIFVPNASISLTALPPSEITFALKKLGKVVEAIRYIGNSPNTQDLTATWPAGIGIFGRRTSGFIPSVFDIARGGSRYWQLSGTSPELIADNSVNFTDDGVTVGASNITNLLNFNLFAWLFRIEKGPFNNQDGSIPTTTLNSEAVSIATYTSNGVSGATIGHGLGGTPDLCIVKLLQGGFGSAYVGGLAVGGAGWYLLANSTASRIFSTTTFRDFNNTTIELGGDGGINSATIFPYICYSFKEVANRSKIGFYSGNGLSGGLFVACGFEVGFLLVKPRNQTGNWMVFTKDMPDLGRRWNTFSSTGELLTQDNFYSFEGKGFRVFNETPNSFGGVDTQLNRTGVEYVYMALAAGFFLKIQCPSVDLGLQVRPVSVSSGVYNKVDSINYSLKVLVPPYAGEGAIVIAIPGQALSLARGQVVLLTGVCIKPALVIVELKAKPVGYAGEATQDILTYFQIVEQADSAELEALAKGSVFKFVRRLKAQNLWDKIQVINLLCVAKTLSGALVPLKGPYPAAPTTTFFTYNRRTGLRPSSFNFGFNLNVFNNDLQVDDHHLAVYVNQLNTFGADLIGDGFTTNSLAIGRFTSTPHFDTRNKNNTTTRSVDPAWSGPSLVGIARSNTTDYDQRIARTTRTIAQASINQSTVLSNRAISLFNNFWNGTGDFRVSVYTAGKAIDMGLLEDEIELFLSDLRDAGIPDKKVFVPSTNININALAPAFATSAIVEVPVQSLEISAIRPLSVARPRTVVGVPATEIELMAMGPLIAA